ncbi:MAG: hypothetical protein V4481_05175 [Patescibacteria group bacterium]
MAQKRMFDRAIIDTDRFMDLPMSAKAIYFLLGMEADDEGFVSYKKVIRIHGGNEDDVKILTAKRFLIIFESGVVVITDWNTNNYLDKNRIRSTEYGREKKMISLTEKGKYELNNGLTSIEESSIEQNSIEESRGDEETPSQIAKDFFSGGNHYRMQLQEFSQKSPRDAVEREFKKFILYWTEPNKSGTKVRWQLEPTFDVKRRLVTWLARVNMDSQRRGAGAGIVV